MGHEVKVIENKPRKVTIGNYTIRCSVDADGAPYFWERDLQTVCPRSGIGTSRSESARREVVKLVCPNENGRPRLKNALTTRGLLLTLATRRDPEALELLDGLLDLLDVDGEMEHFLSVSDHDDA